jgi:hypothetical protein
MNSFIVFLIYKDNGKLMLFDVSELENQSKYRLLSGGITQ